MPKTYSSVPVAERFQTSPCPLCGAAGRSPFLSCDGFSFVRCSECSAIYQDPSPVFEDLRRRYGEGYFAYEHGNESNFFHLMELGLKDVDFDDRTASLREPRTFLDIGCATGMLIESMKRKGWTVKGVDICRESAEYGRRTRGVDIFPGTLQEARFADNSFSVVHFSHLIEHVPDPRGFLAEVRRVLKPGGLAVITTPNVDGFQARLFRAGWRSAIADHLVLFSRRTLGRVLDEAGFRTLRTVTWGGLAIGSAPLAIKKPMDRLAKKLGFGDVVLFLAQKAVQDRVDATS
jgi:2-polyprenyl-3-methyl-5-hydroxy-6-metoxy-1,4-benzoquinol methylase